MGAILAPVCLALVYDQTAYGASVFLNYFFFETVRKPLRGFSLTTRSAGSSTG